MGAFSEEIRRQLEESARIKQSFSDELVGRIGQFAEKSAVALRAGGRIGGATANRAQRPGRVGAYHQSGGADCSGERFRVRTNFLSTDRIAGFAEGRGGGTFDERRKRECGSRSGSGPPPRGVHSGVYGRNRRSADG